MRRKALKLAAAALVIAAAVSGSTLYHGGQPSHAVVAAGHGSTHYHG